eukprot:1763250-Alexandrium_andersonii.AAC.1
MTWQPAWTSSDRGAHLHSRRCSAAMRPIGRVKPAIRARVRPAHNRCDRHRGSQAAHPRARRRAEGVA